MFYSVSLVGRIFTVWLLGNDYLKHLTPMLLFWLPVTFILDLTASQ